MLINALGKSSFIGEADSQLGQLFFSLSKELVQTVDFSVQDAILNDTVFYLLVELAEVLHADFHIVVLLLEGSVLLAQVLDDGTKTFKLSSELFDPALSIKSTFVRTQEAFSCWLPIPFRHCRTSC